MEVFFLNHSCLAFCFVIIKLEPVKQFYLISFSYLAFYFLHLKEITLS